MRVFELVGVCQDIFTDLYTISNSSEHERMQNEGTEEEAQLRLKVIFKAYFHVLRFQRNEQDDLNRQNEHTFEEVACLVLIQKLILLLVFRSHRIERRSKYIHMHCLHQVLVLSAFRLKLTEVVEKPRSFLSSQISGIDDLHVI